MADKIYDQTEDGMMNTEKAEREGEKPDIDYQMLVDITEANNSVVEVYMEKVVYKDGVRKLAVEVDDGEIYRAWLLREDEYIEAKVSRVT